MGTTMAGTRVMSSSVAWIFYVDEDGTISGIENMKSGDVRQIVNVPLLEPDPHPGTPYELEVRIEKYDSNGLKTKEASGCIRGGVPVVWKAADVTDLPMPRSITNASATVTGPVGGTI